MWVGAVVCDVWFEYICGWVGCSSRQGSRQQARIGRGILGWGEEDFVCFLCVDFRCGVFGFFSQPLQLIQQRNPGPSLLYK